MTGHKQSLTQRTQSNAKHLSCFAEVFVDDTKHGFKIPQSDYFEKGQHVIIDQGDNIIAGYSDRVEGLYTDVPVVVFGDHTRIVKYVDKPFFIGADGVKILKPRDEVYPLFGYYALKAARIESLGYSRHFKLVKELKFRLPSLPEQKRIAAVLDKICEMKRNVEARLQKLDLLVKSRFVEMFGDPTSGDGRWPTATLPELGELNRGVSKDRPRNSPDLLGGPYPLIQTGDVSKAELWIREYGSTYSEKGLAQSRLWKRGTLCITIAANIAQTGILDFDACFPDSVVGFVPNKRTNAIFIHYWFSFFQRILEAQAPQVAQKNINLRILSELRAIEPPLILQREFAAFVAEVDKSKFVLRETLSRMETLYRAKLQEYFG